MFTAKMIIAMMISNILFGMNLGTYDYKNVQPDPQLVAYVSQYEGDKSKVNAILDLIYETVPYWKAAYQENEFDCSEMTTFTEFIMVRAGMRPTHMQRINTRTWEAHAWLTYNNLVIQCTDLNIVDKSENSAYNCNLEFSDPRDQLKENDWWDSNVFTTWKNCIELNAREGFNG